MHALPAGVHATPLGSPAVDVLDALVDEVADRVARGSVAVGQSLGGVVAMHLAERHLSRMPGLVLVSAPVGSEDLESANT
ncbi:hypothetical protein [Dietzia cercidiphylli]|uniref:hypothetical protein n=1 Tax=Dietzia cercidiphylli TaxID=498199 RepID=UPI00223BCAE8|nr:hypothetical protein [Dietzia cercidiphylli]MCT1517223.1 hypothetical protein [Dietzia cercidiphylli]